MTKATNATARHANGAAGANKQSDNRRSVESKLKELKRRLIEISDLRAAGSVLGWDHATYMPKGGAEARARHGATLDRLVHEKAVDPALGRLLDALQPYADTLPYDSNDASLIRVARRDFERAVKVPAERRAAASLAVRRSAPLMTGLRIPAGARPRDRSRAAGHRRAGIRPAEPRPATRPGHARRARSSMAYKAASTAR